MELALIGGVFSLISLVCVRAIVGLINQERKLGNAVRVTGELVGYETKTSTRSSQSGGRRMVTHHYPVVRYQTSDGQVLQGASQYAWKGGAAGQQVQVEYAPEDPALYRVAGNNVAKVGLAIVIPVTALFLILGVVFLVVGLR